MQFPFSFWTSSGLTLLPVGPFATLTPNKVSTLPSGTATAPIDQASLYNSSLKYKSFTGANGGSSFSSTYGIFIWSDTFHSTNTGAGGYTIQVDGNDGNLGDSDQNSYAFGGSGGDGASGGGGGVGTGDESTTEYPGGDGGSLGSGTDGFTGPDSGRDCVSGGSGGGGGFANWTGDPYAANYGIGGDGGGSGDNGNPGGGGIGFGGGGGGGDAPFSLDGHPAAGGGGGAGAGIIAVVCRIWTGPFTLSAQGGHGGDVNNPEAQRGGDGGGGVVWAAFQKYDGQTVAHVNGQSTDPGSGTDSGNGTSKLYEIKHDLSLVLHTNWADTWDNT